MEQSKDFDEIVEGIKLDWDDENSLSGWLREMSILFYHLADEIANAETREYQEALSSKDAVFKMSFSEAEARGIVNTSGHKTLLKNRLESLRHLFTSVEWRLKVLIFESSRSRQDSPVPHQA